MENNKKISEEKLEKVSGGIKIILEDAEAEEYIKIKAAMGQFNGYSGGLFGGYSGI